MSRQLLLKLTILLSALTAFAAAAAPDSPVRNTQEKSALDYWKEIGVHLEDVKGVINNGNCHNSPKATVGCVAVINELLSYIEPFRYIDSVKSLVRKDEPEAYVKDYPANIQAFLRANLALVTGSAAPAAPTEELLKAGKAYGELKVGIMKRWKEKIAAGATANFDFEKTLDRITGGMTQLLANEDKRTEILVEAIQTYMTWTFDGHAGIEPLQLMQQMMRSEGQRFFGIGAQVQEQDGYIVVARVLPESPAQKAGLLAGDLIVKLKEPGKDEDFVDIRGWGSNKVTEKLKGDLDSKIEVLVRRDGALVESPVKITRGPVEFKNVETKVVQNYGYIRLGSFTEQAGVAVQTAIQELEGKGVKGLIFDLRNNGGGLVKTAGYIADLFLEDGKKVVEFKKYSFLGENSEIVTGPTEDEPGAGYETKLPLVVLINHGSASASELVSGALRDHERAIIVGTPSFGKGTQQTSMPLAYVPPTIFGALGVRSQAEINPQNYAEFLLHMRSFPFHNRIQRRDENAMQSIAVKFTTARFYQPNGMSNQLIGIHPHFTRYTQPEGPSEPEKKVRREADLFVNVPEADGTKVMPQTSPEVTQCVESNQAAERNFAAARNKFLVDYQLDSAVEVLDCLLSSGQRQP